MFWSVLASVDTRVFTVFHVFSCFPGFNDGRITSDFRSAANVEKTRIIDKTLRNQDASQSEMTKLFELDTVYDPSCGNTF